MINLVFLSCAGLLLSLLIPSVQAEIGPVGDLHITNAVVAPDGFDRVAIVAESSLPGPLIQGVIGDDFQINVINELTNETLLTPTSIHWHGLFQHGNAWADGPVGVTQCPILPDNSYLYTFSVPDQAGTFWYHSHMSTQYCDGLKGPLVIYDPNDPHRNLYDVDDETTIISLTEWYHIPAPELPLPPTANSTLINGLGRFAGGPAVDLAVITVEQGKRYRFRLISMACEPNFNFSIDNHNLTVIEADGVNTQTLTVDVIPIFAAQRYSFVLNATQPIGNYWVRALPNLGDQTFQGGLNSAILRYVGAPVQDPTTTMTTNPVVLQESNLNSLSSGPAPGKHVIGGADVNLILNFTFSDGLFFVNGTSFSPPPVPVLLQILSGTTDPHSLMPTGSVFSLPHNVSVEVQMPGGVVGGGHPIHLHGHDFWVVRSAGSSQTNFNNPVVRDTVNIGNLGDDVAIRFQTNNPGPWFLHCHIDFHLNAGFAIVFAEDINATTTQDPPVAWTNLCKTPGAPVSLPTHSGSSSFPSATSSPPHSSPVP